MAADAAKCDLDKARAALAAVDAALAVSSSSLLNDRLASAREEADQVVKACFSPMLRAFEAGSLMQFPNVAVLPWLSESDTRGVEGEHVCRSDLRHI